MQWFSKIKQLFSSPQEQQVQSETEELVETVDADRKVLQNQPEQRNNEIKAIQKSTPKSTLSPFASRILEKAKIESLKDEDERRNITSPVQLFMTNKEAENRVGHIQRIALERNKKARNQFTDSAKTTFNAFMKRAEKDNK